MLKRALFAGYRCGHYPGQYRDAVVAAEEVHQIKQAREEDGAITNLVLRLTAGTKKSQRQRSKGASERKDHAAQQPELIALETIVKTIAEDYNIYNLEETQDAASILEEVTSYNLQMSQEMCEKVLITSTTILI